MSERFFSALAKLNEAAGEIHSNAAKGEREHIAKLLEAMAAKRGGLASQVLEQAAAAVRNLK